MSKLFQIKEEDLGELERILPEFAEALMPHLDNRLRIKLRRTQTILSNIRWQYGPASEVRVLPADDQPDQPS